MIADMDPWFMVPPNSLKLVFTCNFNLAFTGQTPLNERINYSNHKQGPCVFGARVCSHCLFNDARFADARFAKGIRDDRIFA